MTDDSRRLSGLHPNGDHVTARHLQSGDTLRVWDPWEKEYRTVVLDRKEQPRRAWTVLHMTDGTNYGGGTSGKWNRIERAS